MRVLLTCGGTTDHINPAMALAQMFQTRNSDCEVLFVGTDGGMETRLVPEEGYPIETVTVTNFRRSLSPTSIGRNVRILPNTSKSRKQANAIPDHFQPDLVVSTGDYASFPVVKAATKRGIPTAVHESDAIPGLTTKTLLRVVGVVMIGFGENQGHYDDPGKVVVTGTPVHTDSFRYTRKEAQAELGLTDDRSLVLSVWGSLGTEMMSCRMAECIALECRDGAPFHHIHDVGRNYRAVLDALQGSGLAGHSEVDVREYIYGIPLVMTTADLVLYRIGASTIAGIVAIAKPAVLVPSPNVVADHQTKNTRMLANVDGVVLLPEGESSREELYTLMTRLLSDAPRQEAMSRALQDMVVPDTVEQIYQTLVRLMEKRAN